MSDMSDMSEAGKRETQILSCGQAGYLAHRLEKMVSAYSLDNTYQANVMKAVDIGDETAQNLAGETVPDVSAPAFKYNVMMHDLRLNAQYRLNAAAGTLFNNAGCIDFFKSNGLTIIDLDRLKTAKVKEPSALQWCKDKADILFGTDAKTQARENLEGMGFIKANAARYATKLQYENDRILAFPA